MVRGEEKILKKLEKAVIDYEEEVAEEVSREALDAGIDANKAIMDGLAKGMRIVGDLYEKEEYSIPEVLLCADALERGLKILKPHLASAKEKLNYRIIIGTVEGDIHTIGKNMVRLMFEVGGFDVVDLGEDVSADKFIRELSKNRADIVTLSCMMTTTLSNMKKIIDRIKKDYSKVKILVGGASVTKKTADIYNADGYAESALEALKDAMRMTRLTRI